MTQLNRGVDARNVRTHHLRGFQQGIEYDSIITFCLCPFQSRWASYQTAVMYCVMHVKDDKLAEALHWRTFSPTAQWGWLTSSCLSKYRIQLLYLYSINFLHYIIGKHHSSTVTRFFRWASEVHKNHRSSRNQEPSMQTEKKRFKLFLILLMNPESTQWVVHTLCMRYDGVLCLARGALGVFGCVAHSTRCAHRVY